MPPARAAPRTIIRDPKTASAAPSDERGDQVLDDLRRVLAVAVEQDDDVEAVVDRPAVAALLVAAVAEVAVVADDGERQLIRAW